MADPNRIAILGAGPAGLALALKLLRRKDLSCSVTLFDLKPHVGGIAASFEKDGLYFDHGSHRLHPATSQEIMADIRQLLGDDLLTRPRFGRIALLGKFVKFPLNPLNLATNLPPGFVAGFTWDLLSKPLRNHREEPQSFADALLAGLGKTICREFYFPYARKLWGLEPEEISVVQAQKRVSADSLGKMIRKVLSLVPGFKQEGAGIFYYPRKGYGQISDTLAEAVQKLGGNILLNTMVEEIHLNSERSINLAFRPVKSTAHGPKGDPDHPLENQAFDFVYSTIPVTILARLIRPELPDAVAAAAKQLRYRGMIIHYLILESDQFTPYDAHYIPDDSIIFSRISETKNYSASKEPKGLTGLTFEIPCQVGDHLWTASEEEITKRVLADMERIKLPVSCKVREGFSRKIPQVYPVYDIGFEKRFETIDKHLQGLPGLISLGRQGLFAHDNTHHTMEMAYRASDCLAPDLRWDSLAWQAHREEFEKHVVVD